MTDPTLDPDLPNRGKLGMLMLAVPIVSVAIVGTLYLVLAFLGAQGHPADGPLVEVELRGCPEAQAIVAERAAFVGLPEVVFRPLAATDDAPAGFVMTARFPREERVIASLPGTLSATGKVEVRAGDDGEVLATEADIADATVVPTFLDAPRAQVTLVPEAAKKLKLHMGLHLDDHISVWIDGERYSRRHNAPPEEHGQLDLEQPELPAETRIDRAAHAAVVLAHGALPCPLTVGPVRRLDPGVAP